MTIMELIESTADSHLRISFITHNIVLISLVYNMYIRTIINYLAIKDVPKDQGKFLSR